MNKIGSSQKQPLVASARRAALADDSYWSPSTFDDVPLGDEDLLEMRKTDGKAALAVQDNDGLAVR